MCEFRHIRHNNSYGSSTAAIRESSELNVLHSRGPCSDKPAGVKCRCGRSRRPVCDPRLLALVFVWDAKLLQMDGSQSYAASHNKRTSNLPLDGSSFAWFYAYPRPT